MTADTRIWMYRKGEARLFDHPDAVPSNENWQRFPVGIVEKTGAPSLQVKISYPRERKQKREASSGDTP